MVWRQILQHPWHLWRLVDAEHLLFRRESLGWEVLRRGGGSYYLRLAPVAPAVIVDTEHVLFRRESPGWDVSWRGGEAYSIHGACVTFSARDTQHHPALELSPHRRPHSRSLLTSYRSKRGHTTHHVNQ